MTDARTFHGFVVPLEVHPTHTQLTPTPPPKQTYAQVAFEYAFLLKVQNMLKVKPVPGTAKAGDKDSA